MHKIIVENECGCFRRSDLENNLEIPSKDEALGKAIEIKDRMNEEFCGKHNFQLLEDSENFVISFKSPKTTCCGGGHCG